MVYCSVEEAWGKNFNTIVNSKTRRKITPPRPKKIDNYKIESGMVGSADTNAYASFTPQDNSKQRRERFNTKMEPLEFQRNSGVSELQSNIDTGGPITDSFIEELYYSKEKQNETPSQYSLLNAANANVVVSNQHLQNQYRKYIDYIERLEKRIEHLEAELKRERGRTGNTGLYNLIIYVVTGIFIIFLLDAFVRLGKCIGSGGLGGSLELRQQPKFIPDLREYLPKRPLNGGTFVPNRFYYS